MPWWLVSMVSNGVIKQDVVTAPRAIIAASRFYDKLPREDKDVGSHQHIYDVVQVVALDTGYITHWEVRDEEEKDYTAVREAFPDNAERARRHRDLVFGRQFVEQIDVLCTAYAGKDPAPALRVLESLAKYGKFTKERAKLVAYNLCFTLQYKGIGE